MKIWVNSILLTLILGALITIALLYKYSPNIKYPLVTPYGLIDMNGEVTTYYDIIERKCAEEEKVSFGFLDCGFGDSKYFEIWGGGREGCMKVNNDSVNRWGGHKKAQEYLTSAVNTCIKQSFLRELSTNTIFGPSYFYELEEDAKLK